MTNEENIDKNKPVNNDTRQDEEEITQQPDKKNNDQTSNSGEIDLTISEDDASDVDQYSDESSGQVKTALLITDENLKRPQPKPQSPDDIRVAVDTKVISRTYLRRVREEATQDADTEQRLEESEIAAKHEVVLVVRGMVERLHLEEEKTYILGRTDLKSRSIPDIDLTPYGALDRGVSREHATIHLKDKHIYITDLESTNGTFVAGERLAPNEPQILHRGDSLLLGRLAIQVMFR